MSRLRRLQTDCIDLVQHHEIIRYEDPHRIFDDDGAHAALVEARKAGKLRYIGFTGHKDPRIHLYMLEVAQRAAASSSTRCRCRSTSWTRTTAASKNWFCPSW